MYHGKKISLSVFGESHGPGIGCVLEGVRAGTAIDMDYINGVMARRAPGSALSTPRVEKDAAVLLSGVKEGLATGTPICAYIANTSQRRGDYDNLLNVPRPAHADYTAHIKYGGYADMSGGGHFSGRLTAPLALAGAIAMSALENAGIKIASRIASVGGAAIACVDDLKKAVTAAAADGDSVGAVVEVCASGVAPGLGGPLFDGMEGAVAYLMFAIPGVKGVEFGAGFALSAMRGSQANDSFEVKDGRVVTKTNNCGGILGGITTGGDVTLRVAFKPTPSISKTQESVNLKTMRQAELNVGGRHDPCIAVRGAVVCECALALAIYDTGEY